MAPASYRPDIDGLRAVAVVSVVLYHLDKSYVPGGFAGVDIFFVISGFLITGIIARDLREGRFSFWDFYARRVRRIYPALLLVIAASMVAGYALMLPPDLSLLGDSARWAAFGLSNFFFLSQAGYFGPDAARMPLLHTWSLGVEEQFYFLWPLLAFAAWRVGRWARWSLPAIAALIALASVVYALLIFRNEPDLAFYSPLARAWELAIGALVVFAPTIRHRWLAEAAASIGAALIAICLVTSSGGSGVYPDLLLACAGAALLVWPKQQPTLVGAALSVRLIRFVGEISYSLYLWHWPLLVFLAHYYLFDDSLSPIALAAYFASLLVLSTLSWAFVERPLRMWRPKAHTAVVGGAAVAALLAVVGWGLTAAQGLPYRVPENAARYASYLDHQTNGTKRFACWSSNNVDPAQFDERNCINIDAGRPDVLLIGDSHANQFITALRTVFPEINFSYVGSAGCYPMYKLRGSERCTETMRRVYEKYIPNNRFDAVILSARWKSPRLGLVPSTVQYLHQYTDRVIFLGPSPEYKRELPTLLAYAALRQTSVSQADEANGPVRSGERKLRKQATSLGAQYYSTLEAMCPKGVCRALTPDDEPMLVDKNHLTDAGGILVIRQLRKKGLLADLLPAN